MDSDILQALQRELTCSICLNYLLDPVTMGCGHSFCHPCLCLFWEEAQTRALCPVCREPSQQIDFKTNIRLKNLVSIARKASLKHFLKSKEHMCVTHQERKKIFCEEDKNQLCVLCSNSEEHRAHRHSPIEEAAEEYREKFVKEMRSFWKKMKENQRNLQRENRKINQWVLYMEMHRGATKAAYEMLHPDVHEKEKEHLEILTKEHKITVRQLKKSKAKMLQKRKQLKKVYKDLMNMCHKPDVELLQDIEETLAIIDEVLVLEDQFNFFLCWCELVVLHMPQPVRPRLSAQPITGLVDRLKHFQVNFSFHNEVNSRNIMLFNDVRSLLFGQDNEDESLILGRSNFFAAWGDQPFASGKHYWELNVSDSWDWAVGVCRDSVVRKHHTPIEFEDVFLLSSVKEDKHVTLVTTSPIFFLYLEKPLDCVGVFLDFQNGSVGFLNVAKSSLIWRSPAGSLNSPVRPFFFHRPNIIMDNSGT